MRGSQLNMFKACNLMWFQRGNPAKKEEKWESAWFMVHYAIANKLLKKLRGCQLGILMAIDIVMLGSSGGS